MAIPWKNTRAGYGWLAISLHWLMLALLVAVYASMEFKSVFAKGSQAREAMATWHYMLGLSVFCLVWLRALAQLAGERPVTDPGMPAWQGLAARIVQWALYALMIALPLLGWLTLSAKGTVVPLFGLELPALMAKNPEQAKWLKEIHETVATAGYFIVGLHAAAALFHHYIKRDNTLRLMLPRLTRKT
jgi:cytochrome b561